MFSQYNHQVFSPISNWLLNDAQFLPCGKLLPFSSLLLPWWLQYEMAAWDFVSYSFINHSFALSSFLSPSSSCLSFWDEKQGISLSPLFQSQSVADPSSEGDYPSISISHTLISHVSLWSFVSATPHPAWRDFSLLADWEVLAYTEGAIFWKSSRVWSKANAFHRLRHGVISFNFHCCYDSLIGVLVCS